MNLQDKVAIVTGGGGDIGGAVARRYAREGARVAVADINLGDAEKVAADIVSAGGSAIALPVDVRSRASVEDMVARTVREFGRVDILAAIAGIAYIEPFMSINDERWNKTLEVNLTGVFLCGQVTAAQMIKQGRGGKIVNMASTNGLVAEADMAHYNASKFGVVGLTMSMAIELAPHNINVNAVCPGLIRTRLNDEYLADPAFLAEYFKRIPQGRFGKPDEVAGCFVFLASDDASFITGTTLVVDGGQLTF